MKWIIGIMIVLFMVSCDDTPEYWKNQSDRYWDNNNIIVEVKGCEYICFYRGDATWGAHKGDCKNPIHQFNKSNVDVKFYNDKGGYDGKITIDSIIVKFDKKRIDYWSHGKIVYMVEITGWGMLVDTDLKK